MSTDIAPAASPQAPAVTPIDRVSALYGNFTFDGSLLATASNETAGEAFRALRTQLVAQHFEDGKRALTVCGASQGVGCTYVAANLAVAFSQIGLRTLLIDGDLRQPGVDQLIRPEQKVPGFLECLTSPDKPLYDFITGDVRSNLSVMFSSIAPNPQELLAGRRFRDLLNFCLRNYDVTIVDTPPANNSSDSRLIASLLGYGLVVAGRNESFVADVKTLVYELQTAGARVVGTVLNEG